MVEAVVALLHEVGVEQGAVAQHRVADLTQPLLVLGVQVTPPVLVGGPAGHVGHAAHGHRAEHVVHGFDRVTGKLDEDARVP